MDIKPVSCTTSVVLAQLGNPGVKLIDTRSADAYNGWAERNELRSGHIVNAKNLPVKWLNYYDWPEIVWSKNIRPSDTLIIYGYEPEDIQKVASHFRRAGYANLRAYYDFVDEWTAAADFPMSRLPRYRSLVPAQWLHSLITKRTAPGWNNTRFVICHAHYRNKGAYDEGHIPGAIDLDTNTLESPDTWNRRSPSEIKQTLEQAGITSSTSVILYGRNSIPDSGDPFPGSSAGQLGAMRCALILLYAGVNDVRILNGGLQAWIDAGFQTTTERTPPTPVPDFGAAIPLHPEYIIDIEEARAILGSSERNLVCVRSWPEYIGQVSGYNYIGKKGRIPGAIFADCGSDAYHMENYRNADHTTREYHEIEQLWLKAGISPVKNNAFYCGTGWRASEAFFNAWLMGWPGISVYDGGWFEWSNDDKNPIETGIPERG